MLYLIRYEKAALHGSPDALSYLKEVYTKGLNNTKPNLQKCIQYAIIAAEKNYNYIEYVKHLKQFNSMYYRFL